MSTLVIRLSSMGDIVLAGAVTGALAPVDFLTMPRFAELAARLPGVRRVIRYGVDEIPAADRVVDLQSSPRTWRLGRARRVRRLDLRRRVRVWWKVGAPPPLVVERYAQAARVTVAPAPWISVSGPKDALLLCPGAAWATKRWAPERWVGLGRAWEGPVLVLGGPQEAALVEAIAAEIGAEAISEAGFGRTFEALGRGRVAVAGDTGLLHLCGAAGIPLVGLFGPTTSIDGFWCWPGKVIERPYACRPCSRFGSEHCPVGDHLCLADIGVDEVLAAAREVAR